MMANPGFVLGTRVCVSARRAVIGRMDADDAAELALLPNQCKFQLDVGSQGTIVYVSSRGSVHCEFVVPLQGIDVLFETKVHMRLFDACFLQTSELNILRTKPNV